MNPYLKTNFIYICLLNWALAGKATTTYTNCLSSAWTLFFFWLPSLLTNFWKFIISWI